MSENEVNRKINNAIKTITNKFPKPFFKAIKLNDSTCPFHLEIFRNEEGKGDEIFKFRITLDSITEEDIRLCREYKLPEKIFTKIIVCKKREHGKYEYLTVEKSSVNSKSPHF